MRQSEREDLISFFENVADHNLRELFDIVQEVKDNIIFDTTSEEQTFDMFSTYLWKATEGYELVVDGKNRKFMEEEED